MASDVGKATPAARKGAPGGKGKPKAKATSSAEKEASITGKWTASALKAEFDKLGYNMLDTELAATSIATSQNPAKTYKDLKVLAHKALATGRDNVAKGDLATANKNFAFAYQMRCVCDWIWKNLMGKQGDTGHAAFLRLSTGFGKLCANKTSLSDTKKAKIFELISDIKD